MPIKPLRPCGHPGCAALTAGGRCPEHRTAERRVVDARRGSSTARGYDRRWRAYATRFLRAYPLCAACRADDRVTAATTVDHIIPHRGDRLLFWDPANHQALCTRCHSVKTATTDGGFGNRRSVPA